MKKLAFFIVLLVLFGLNEAIGQWGTNGTHIYNSNTGNVGIGINTPGYLLHVSKNTVAPSIRIQNAGGTGGAAFEMVDNFSGANWKFKATNAGGFKIRDHASGLDVFFIEQNSAANLLYLKSGGNIGIGTNTPESSAMLDVNSTNKGFLPPRMTLVELNAISAPVDGLIAYCIDCGSGGLGALLIYMAGTWYTLTTNCLIQTPAEGSHVPAGTQIIWNWNSVTGAIGYKWNTSDDYASAEDMGSNTTKTETDLAYGTSYTRYAWSYNGCGYSTPVTLIETTLDFACGSSLIINHVTGTVAPVDKTVTYGTVTSIPGETSKCWITSNLGASHQATAVNDATEASAGWYWQFNRMQGYKHDGTIRTPNTTWISSINESSDWITANDPCNIELSDSWRIPTYTEWYNVDNDGGWTDWNGPWNSGLKLHAAGDLLPTNGSLVNRGSYGFYWGSTQGSSSLGSSLTFNSGACFMGNFNKASGYPVRCVQD